MKKTVITLILILLFICLLYFSVSAETLEELNKASGAYSLGENLPDEIINDLEEFGINSSDPTSVQNFSFNDILGFLINTANNEIGGILPSICVVLAILLLYSMFSGVFDGITSPSLSSVLSVVSALSLACVLLFPVCSLIESANRAITVSADFMLAYLPVMTAILISAGQNATGSGYSAMMVLAAESVSQFFSKIISPLLNCLLALGISTAIIPEIKLTGLVNFLSKSVKWLMSFVFMLFTAMLTLKSIFSSSIDNVSSRAVRYTVSSFVPVVGGALSEAYRTIHGSVGVLKSGVGVFVIIAVITVFIPVVVKLLVWLCTISLCKSFAETTNLSAPCQMLSSISTVISLILSVIICVVALFVITTALIITIGGGT